MEDERAEDSYETIDLRGCTNQYVGTIPIVSQPEHADLVLTVFGLHVHSRKIIIHSCA